MADTKGKLSPGVYFCRMSNKHLAECVVAGLRDLEEAMNPDSFYNLRLRLRGQVRTLADMSPSEHRALEEKYGVPLKFGGLPL